MAKRDTKKSGRRQADHASTEGADEAQGEEWITRSIRFPPALYAKLEEDAKKERRSTQLQIIWMIEEAYRLREGK